MLLAGFGMLLTGFVIGLEGLVAAKFVPPGLPG
jgi:hypothetical protein